MSDWNGALRRLSRKYRGAASMASRKEKAIGSAPKPWAALWRVSFQHKDKILLWNIGADMQSISSRSQLRIQVSISFRSGPLLPGTWSFRIPLPQRHAQ